LTNRNERPELLSSLYIEKLFNSGLNKIHTLKLQTKIFLLICVMAIYAVTMAPSLQHHQQAFATQSSGASKASNTVTQLMEKAASLIRQGNNNESIKYFDQALALEPNNTTVLLNKAIVLFDTGNYHQALPIFDDVLKIEPNRTAAISYKGQILLQNRNYLDAIKYFDRILASNAEPSYKKIALFSKGAALLQAGKYNDALKNFDIALTLGPNDPLVLANKGLALAGLGKYTEAISIYDKALAIDPSNSNILNYKEIALKASQKSGLTNMTSTSRPNTGNQTEINNESSSGEGTSSAPPFIHSG
jgi:tetratricopeptide (TPR) repeat protein